MDVLDMRLLDSCLRVSFIGLSFAFAFFAMALLGNPMTLNDHDS